MIMVQFNVNYFYANIPIIYKLNIIKENVNNDDHFTRKNGYTPRQVSWSIQYGFNNHSTYF